MILALSTISTIELIALAWIWIRRGADQVVLLIFIMAFIFAVLPPLLYSFGTLAPAYISYHITNSGVLEYSFSSMIFFTAALIVTAVVPRLPGISYFKSSDSSSSTIHQGVFKVEPRLSIRALWVCWAVAVLASYISGITRFSSVAYVFHDVNAFQVMMATARGGWYLTVLSTAFVLPAILLLEYYARTRSRRTFLVIFVLNIALMLFVSKLATRTPILSYALCAVIISRPLWSRSAFYAVTALSVPLGVVALFMLNSFRQGARSTFELGAMFNSLVLNFTPALNGAFLIERGVEYQYFKNTIIALTPIPLVPRALFPYKAYDDIQALLTQDLFPYLDPTFFAKGSTLTYTMVGSSYANMGNVGVFIGGMAWCLAIWIVALFSRGQASLRALAIYLALVMAVGFRTSLETIFVNLQFFTYFYIVICIFARERRIQPLKQVRPA